MQIYKWDEQFKEDFKSWDRDKQSRAIFLEEHPDYPFYLLVNSLDPLFVHSLKEVIGEYRAVHKLDIKKLISVAKEAGFESTVYINDPNNLFNFIDHLDDPYPYDLGVTLKKFQLRGFNYTKDLDSAIINWSTGTGKSILAVAKAKYLLEQDKVDKVVILSKAHNKTNWQRTFLKIGNLEAHVDDDVEGSNPSVRRQNRAALYKSSKLIVINYEKMRFRPTKETPRFDETGKKMPASSGDGQELLDALKGKRVLFVWDEMPNKMKSMRTAWYRGAQKLLKKTKKNYQLELTAKKLDRDPENVYACTKILDPTIWPNLATFRNMYAKNVSQWSRWRVATWDASRLPELGMRLSHITHIANKYTDPEIRAEFPEDHWEDILIDMSKSDRKLYDAVREATIANSQKLTINKLIPLQLVCNNPILLARSESEIAQHVVANHKVTDQNCAKLETLRDLLGDVEGKAVIFTMFNTYGIHMLAPYLAKWGYTFVVYDGTRAAMQAAQDRFRADDKIKIFLSSDQGSDSIDLEQATTVINYDLPWNHSTLIQRVNRISRLTSEADHVFFYNLITTDSMEEKKMALLERKRLMEEAIDQPIAVQSDIISRSSMDELNSLLDV